MAHRCFSGLLLSAVIILVALGSAECDQGSCNSCYMNVHVQDPIFFAKN